MILTKSKIFLIFCLAFIIGVFLGKFINLEIMAMSAMIFIVITSINWDHALSRTLGLAGLCLVIGMSRMYFSATGQQVAPYFGKTLNIQGLVAEEPDVRSDKTYLTLGKVLIEGRPLDDRILLSVPRFPQYQYGDELTLTGKVTEPKDAKAAGEFSYKNYLSRFGTAAVIFRPHIDQVSSNHGNKVISAILKLKNRFTENLSKLLPEPENSFLAGLLVGQRRTIPADITAQLNATGTTHVIAISGFNITIIAYALDKLLQRFGRRISFILSLLAIVVFVILTGASSSVVRAGIMGSLGLLALNIGRVYAITNALVASAALMLLINPKILHFDVGFQLSFLALLGLVYLTPLIEPYFKRLPNFIRINLVATMAAQIFTLPILLYNFDRLSLVAPLTNILVLAAVPVTMLAGFTTGLLALIFLWIAKPFAWVTWFLLAYILKIVALTSKIPFASIEIKNFYFPLVIFYYLALILVLLNFYFHSQLSGLFSKWKIKLRSS